MIRYFRKEIPTNALHLPTGKRAPFRPSQSGKVGILATADPGLLEHLNASVQRKVGGVVEISENEYLILRDGNPTPVAPKRKQPKKLQKARMKTTLVDSGIRSVGRFIHVVERHKQRDIESERRVENALTSWLHHYHKGMPSCHVWEWQYPRSADETIGDPRHLPYLKDVLAEGLKIATEPDDIVFLTNDDTVIHHHIVTAMTRMLQNVDALSSFRMNFKKDQMPALDTPTAKIRQWGEACYGRDLFAFRAEWLRRNWAEIPDMILGAREWDLVMAALVRIAAGLIPTKENFSCQEPKCELDRGMVIHEVHERMWMTDKFSKSPAAVHNNRLYCKWMAEHGLEELIGQTL